MLAFSTEGAVSLLREGSAEEVLQTPEGSSPAELTWDESGDVLGWWSRSSDGLRSTVGVYDPDSASGATRELTESVRDVALLGDSAYVVTNGSIDEHSTLLEIPIRVRNGGRIRLGEPHEVPLGKGAEGGRVFAVEAENVGGDLLVAGSDEFGTSSHGGPGKVVRLGADGAVSLLADDSMLSAVDGYNSFPGLLRAEGRGSGFLYSGAAIARHDMCQATEKLLRREDGKAEPVSVVFLPEAGAGESFGVLAVEPAPDGSVLVAALSRPDDCLGKEIRLEPVLLRVRGTEVSTVAEGIAWASEEGGMTAALRASILREARGRESLEGGALLVGEDIATATTVARGVFHAAWQPTGD